MPDGLGAVVPQLEPVFHAKLQISGHNNHLKNMGTRQLAAVWPKKSLGLLLLY